MDEIKDSFKKCVLHNMWFKVLLMFSILLIAASWLWPPTAIIDASVLAAVGELAGLAAIGTVVKALDMGKKASVSHGNTTISVENNLPELGDNGEETEEDI